MILPIYNAFHPILKTKTQPVENIDDGIVNLVNDMFETMQYAEGIGLAANQVGKSVSLLVVGDIYDENDKLVHPKQAYLNPEILAFSDEEEEFNEGCLSVPELREDVVRPTEIQLRFVDINGKEQNLFANGLLARVLQHEIDHLNGILFFERISPFRRTLIQNKLRKIKNGLIVPDYPMVLPNGQLTKEYVDVNK
ncbi:MAG: Peptide deformylase [Candidatus Kapaibacterium sp.]|jgi:peptide deformylase|nr:MAG: Peptide deformylase [Candidatus Kapabacteria bacterium]ROL58372.1 MAG: peptide deformylase [Bacteroidetes/Chlorobi group bacterium Naka2016]